MVRLARRHPRMVLLAALLVAVLPLGLWLRGASIVRVTDVEVTGIAGSHAAEVREALTAAAQNMTTLNVREDDLKDAVRRYPIVHGISTETGFPHKLRITVEAYEPVAALQAGGQPIAVSSDGTLLRGSSTAGLAVVGLRTMPGGDRLRDRRAGAAVRFLAAAPTALRARVERMVSYERNLIALLRDGPKLYFGDGTRRVPKWSAAARVLADRASRGALYVDLRLPERPVAGGLPVPVEIPSTSTSG